MDASLLEACQAFSRGRSEPVGPFLHQSITWTMAGGEEVRGTAALLERCAENLASGCPEIVLTRTLRGDDHLLVEGRSVEGESEDEPRFHFADVFEITDQQVVAIRSYVICHS